MKINRWILIPLIFIAAYVLPRLLFDKNISATELLVWAIVGFAVGAVGLLWGDARARKLTGTDDPAIYEVRQKRELTLLLNYEKAFEVCLEAAQSLNPAKIKENNPGAGIIKFRTRLKWSSFGEIITINLKKLNETLTEVEINTRPIPRTALVGSGNEWKCAEELVRFMKEKDAELNRRILADSVSIMEDVYVKPFQKEKIER